MSPPSARLSARDLALTRGGRPLLDGLSLDVGPSEIVTIEGPSGCGKSTLLRVLAAQMSPERGRILVDGRDVSEGSPRMHRRRVALLFQQPPMLEGTVADNVAEGPRLRGETMPRAEVSALLAAVDLAGTEGRDARSLSGGEKQRVALARALANEPSVLLLDEPTSALDAVSAESVLALVRRVAARGLGVVMVTHSAEHAARIATRRLRMSAGALSPVGAA